MKILTTIGFIISTTLITFSQKVEKEKQFSKNHFTFSTGLATYSIFGSQVDLEASAPASRAKSNSRNGFRFDFSYKRLVTSVFFVNTGISIIQKGGSQTGTGFIDYARLEKTYLQIPLLIGIQGSNPNSRLGLAGGVGLCTEISSGNSTTGSGWISKSFKSNTSTSSILLSTFYETKLSNKCQINFKVLYETDLSSTIERVSSSNKAYEIKTQGLSFTVGITIIE